MSSSILAIMFADISGSTRLYETLGDAAARLRTHALAFASGDGRAELAP